VVLLAGFLLPLPSSAVSEALVWVPRDAEVRAEAAGFILPRPHQSMQPIAAGDAVAQLEDLGLSARHREQLAKVDEIAAQTTADQASERARAYQARAALQREQQVLDDLEQRLRQLVVVAPATGTFMRASSDDLPGRYVKRGELLGYVLPSSQRTIRAVVTQDHIALVRSELAGIEVMLADRIGETWSGTIVHAVPQADEHLPGKALTLEGGGAFVLDPRAPAAVRTLNKVFQLEIALLAPPPDLHVGTRAYVRFRFKPEPAFRQLARLVRQVFLSRLHV